MNFGQAVKMAAKSIFSNKGRSALTMLGIVIGLAAVMVLVTYAQGQNMAMKAFYDSMGTNIVQVSAYSWMDNTNEIGKKLYNYSLGHKDVLGITPTGNIWNDVTIKYESKTLSREQGRRRIPMAGGGVMITDGGMNGMEDNYPQISLGNDKFSLCNGYTILKGRDITYLEVERLSQVCVLGSATAEYLFSFADPIGKTISLNGRPFTVVGVYESKAAGVNTGKPGKDGEMNNNDWMLDSIKRMDKIIVLPYTMTRYFNQNQPIESYVVKVKTSGAISKVIADLNGYLGGLINQSNGSFYVGSPEAEKQNMSKADELQQRFLGGIAAISLLVGGIGIMNIMLVTVTERTREIGIRKAIGAERRSIITQFLIEAAMICGIGGVFGIGAGYLGSMIVGKISFDTILIPSPMVTAGAFAISVVLGIVFGLYPAIKASGLQPVDALRAE